jgi:glycosyltransferase involved in cell wall biosynthesis
VPAVLHVTQPTTEGVGLFVRDLAIDEAARGWKVDVASPPDDELERALAQAGVGHRRWDAQRAPGPSVVSETRSLGRIIDRLAPEVVYLHSSKAGLAGRLALRGRRPTAFTPHAWSFLHGGRVTRTLARRWERWGSRWTDVILCVSEAECRRGLAVGIRARLEVVPPAVNATLFVPVSPSERTALRGELGVDADAPMAVCLGRLAPQKGQDILVAAWPEVTRAVPDAQLYLVGDGPARRELDAESTPSIHVVGLADNARAWLAVADVAVVPSRWEGFPVVALEATACGVPVVGSDVDGMIEAIGSGANAAGAVVTPGDRVALASAIVDRLRDPVRARAEGARGRLRAVDLSPATRFDAVAEALLELTVPGSGPSVGGKSDVSR